MKSTEWPISGALEVSIWIQPASLTVWVRKVEAEAAFRMVAKAKDHRIEDSTDSI